MSEEQKLEKAVVLFVDGTWMCFFKIFVLFTWN